MSKVDSIKIRMYNTGSVGDCILLLFQKGKKTSFSILIDCGGWNTTKGQITPVVEDIRDTCNKKLDLLIVTHQHLDHVSGFNQARTVFDEIKVDTVWMSWIEDKNDPIAKVLKTKFGKTLKELKEQVDNSLKNMSKEKPLPISLNGYDKRMKNKQLKMVNALNLLNFELGIEPGIKSAKAAKATNDAAMEYVRKKGKIEYRIPGEVISELPGAEGIKFYILGPPRDRDMKFFKIAMNEKEMYQLAMNSPTEETEMPEEENLLEAGVTLKDGQSPFSSQYHMDASESRNFRKEYNSDDIIWRQIETDWQETAASIALRATRLTNNTSLAMAIELEDSGQVILLPGDAQSGNWMGWHKPDVSKKLKDLGGKSTVELLNSTVFYKVGHHGSHNGTASVSGLEHIKSQRLVAMMPLIQSAVPEEWGGSKNFPAKVLYNVLIDKTRGRLIRTDQGIVTAARAQKLRNLLSREEKKEFTKGFVKGKNYVEYTINSD